MSNLTTMTNNVYSKINKKTILIIVLILIILATIVLLVLKKEKNVQEFNLTPLQHQETPKPVPIGSEVSNNTYFLNRVNDITQKITGYSWLNNKLLYSTSNGIYSPFEPEPLVNTNISQISWSDNAKALYFNGSWHLFDGTNNNDKIIPISASISLLDGIGENIFTVQDNQLTIYNLSREENKSMLFEGKYENLFFTKNSQLFIFITNSSQYINVTLYNYSFEAKNQINIPKGSEIQSVSLNGEEFVYWNPLLKTLNIQSFGSSEPRVLDFDEVFSTNSRWLTSNKIFVVASKKDRLDRTIDYFYYVESTGKKEYLANSIAMINKVNTKLRIIPNPQETIIAMPENSSGVWLMSLRPDLVPEYTLEGVTFIQIKPTGQEFEAP